MTDEPLVDPALRALAERALRFGASRLGLGGLTLKFVVPWTDGRLGEFRPDTPDTIWLSSAVSHQDVVRTCFHEAAHAMEHARGFFPLSEAVADAVEPVLTAEWREREAASEAEREATAAYMKHQELLFRAMRAGAGGVGLGRDWRTREPEPPPMRAIRGLGRSDT